MKTEENVVSIEKIKNVCLGSNFWRKIYDEELLKKENYDNLKHSEKLLEHIEEVLGHSVECYDLKEINEHEEFKVQNRTFFWESIERYYRSSYSIRSEGDYYKSKFIERKFLLTLDRGNFHCRPVTSSKLIDVYFIGNLERYEGYIPFDALQKKQKLLNNQRSKDSNFSSFNSCECVILDTDFRRFSEYHQIKSDPMFGFVFEKGSIKKFYCLHRWISEENIKILNEQK